MKHLQNWPSRMEERMEEGSRRVTSKWEWKLKIMRSAVASATKEISKVYSEFLNECCG